MSFGCNSSQIVLANQSFNATPPTWEMDGYAISKICLMAPVVLLSLFGNLSVIAVVYLSASLRSTVNYLLVNLAIADFLFTLFCWPLVINRITHPLYVLGRYICKINVLVEVTSVTVSVLTLAAVACDRLYAVTMPIRARNATSFPSVAISAIWAISVVVALPSFYMRDLQVVELSDLTLESCTDVDHLCTEATRRAFRYYHVLLVLILFFVPGAVMVLAYTVIVWKLWCVRASTLSENQPLQHLWARRKVVVMTAVVLAAFILCWSPLNAIMLYNYFNDAAMPPWIEPALFWIYLLAYCNSALNPLLYGGFSDNFRQGFRAFYRDLFRLNGRGQHQLYRAPAERQTITIRVSNPLSNSQQKRTASAKT
ncbi:D(2) dopamine receptor A-like [Penaeus japonicus]|uniref:D(2) dopamine receptor A-like n=1 Tax=Penaeus japonicus TaxID=27405 RepID=UPI001C713A1B|nr:D(2) dopamine receptor A-like [Penaeus japonicus]